MVGHISTEILSGLLAETPGFLGPPPVSGTKLHAPRLMIRVLRDIPETDFPIYGRDVEGGRLAFFSSLLEWEKGLGDNFSRAGVLSRSPLEHVWTSV